MSLFWSDCHVNAITSLITLDSGRSQAAALDVR